MSDKSGEKSNEKKRLGKGLSALYGNLPGVGKSYAAANVGGTGGTSATTATVVNNASQMVVDIEISKIIANPDQPRRLFNAAELDELALSIKEHGILQPLLVRKMQGKEMYEIIAGERRFRASQIAGLRTVPCIIKDFDDSKTFEVALIENIQRKDLNPVEEAMGYARLLDEFGYTQDKIAKQIGKSRAYVANIARLISLPKEVLELLANGSISTGHARTLLTLHPTDAINVALHVVKEGWSVRRLEGFIKEAVAKQNAQGEPTKQEPETTSQEQHEATENVAMAEDEETETEDDGFETEEDDLETEQTLDEDEDGDFEEEELDDEDLEIEEEAENISQPTSPMQKQTHSPQPTQEQESVWEEEDSIDEEDAGGSKTDVVSDVDSQNDEENQNETEDFTDFEDNTDFSKLHEEGVNNTQDHDLNDAISGAKSKDSKIFYEQKEIEERIKQLESRIKGSAQGVNEQSAQEDSSNNTIATTSMLPENYTQARLNEIEEDVARVIDLDINIKKDFNKESGKVTIAFSRRADLDKILNILMNGSKK